MKSSNADLSAAVSPLVELLDHSFLDGTDDDTAMAAAVPTELWNRALLDPLREFLARPSKEFRGRLLELGFRIGGGAPNAHPRELPLLIESLHAGSLIIDDIEDDSDLRRGDVAVHRRHGVAVALNAGNWLYYWAQVLMSRLPLDDATRLVAHERLAASLLRCHEGQALDLTVQVDKLAQAQVAAVVQGISRLKTGSLLGLATFLGALAAGADQARLEAIAAFGRGAGVGLQMLDDLSGILNAKRLHKAVEDLQHGRATWPWAWLAQDLPEHRYGQLCSELRDVRNGAPAQLLVERMRDQLAEVGLQRARAQLEGATDVLRATIGDGDWCEDVRAEVCWLEQQYVQS